MLVPNRARASALVISLDFELHWGVRDLRKLDATERSRLLSARRVIPHLLSLFDEFHIHATWATVGFLFAESRDQLDQYMPAQKPTYSRSQLNPYLEEIGANEAEDPFHFGLSLIEEVARHPGQEIASHSFSHYYSMEPGQTEEQFEADLASALAIAAEAGFALHSYVFPRNQANARYLPALERAGVKCYRGAEPAAVNRPAESEQQRRFYKRAGRLADTYLNLFGAKTHAWPQEQGLASIPGSRYLAPYRGWLNVLEETRLQRIVGAMEHAARQGEIFHLWWHPEDFAYDCDLNLRFLHSILLAFEDLKARFDMQSLSMAETLATEPVADEVLVEEFS
jgi:peptidoglycan/xylan/chitin deacetylase (PgdA/CDA1 family)